MSDALTRQLDEISDPATGKGLQTAGRLDGVAVSNGVATIVLKTQPGEDVSALKKDIEACALRVNDVDRVRIITTLQRPASGAGDAPQGQGGPQADPRQASPKAPKPADLVIAVAAGKGGVGKSTVAANLAAALTKAGKRVAILDADIYGPSVPRLLGLQDTMGLKKTDKGIEPARAHGVSVVSMGFLTKPNQPVVWRGPMIQGAIQQFLNETDWGQPDVLIIDMPPGTGDAQLAIAQTLAIDGAVIACTPQDLALDDARKAMTMFEKTHTPILGLIENMSVFLCPHCGEPSEIFGHGGTRAEAQTMGVPFLGEIPLTIELRERSDTGRPVAFDDGPVADAFARAAEGVLASASEARKAAPEIVFSD
ncbi:Mrp/NBP35 family ATP-binding protein [Hyphobacterium sp. HN65]|uniref:Iron-sulfur cluster carrier protein n=1 Tax=Hyphobacterium lacteum TaxID=3116575 RepID=A0ABU7LPI8_9PROT|nr:Mrp/NBP35 family ATP-binding protein [Hyphobacterium sp. HN65]MEE2525829.1 Mrp/NBP35 family ATP-binding protein [Hyphobacterium sp. HN65]